MVQKEAEKIQAIELRKSGASYREILSIVKVAKSTLSLWLRSVRLAKRQQQVLTEKRRIAALRGGARRKELRIISAANVGVLAKNEASRLKDRELWLAGIMLYWAEGSKQKETNISQGTKFSNSDSKMVRLFLKWLKEICGVTDDEIKCELYIHNSGNVKIANNYWNKHLKPLKINATYFKKNKIRTNRKNIGDKYYGLVTLRVKKSTNLNRKISAWIDLFLKNRDIGE